MTDLLAELTAPAPARETGTIARILAEETTANAEAIRGALDSKVSPTLLAERLNDRGWPITRRMVEEWRRKPKAAE